MFSRHVHPFAILFCLCVLCSSPAWSVTFGTEDLAGTWYGHQVVTGDAPADDPRWGYGTVTMDNAGNYTADWTSPSSANEITTGMIQINSNGLFTVNNQPLTHGAMNDAKDLLVFTDGTQESKGHALVVLVKRGTGTGFSNADLAGTWYGHQVVAGDRPADDPRWGYGTVTVDNAGNYTAGWTSPSSANEITTGMIQINSNGLFTVNNQPLTHGVMNDAKDLLVFTDGTQESKGHALIVLVKRETGTAFSNADFAGFWYGYHVVSGDAPGDDPRWGYGSAEIDDSGNYEVTWNSATSTNELSAGSITTGPNGIFTINNQPLMHGVINDAKDFFIFIDGTAESAGNALSIFIKRSPAVNTGTNLLLLNALK
jgi:hypothetical protein